jgi:hypothetical protein
VERMLLPERALGIKRGNGCGVMFAPAALPHSCPPLSCLSCVHGHRVGGGTDKRPGDGRDCPG